MRKNGTMKDRNESAHILLFFVGTRIIAYIQMGTIVKTSVPDDPDVFEVMGMMGLAALVEENVPAYSIVLTLSNRDGNNDAPTVSTIVVEYCASEGEFFYFSGKICHLFAVADPGFPREGGVKRKGGGINLLFWPKFSKN